MSQRTKIILAYLVIYLVWGTTFLGVRWSLDSFPPFLLSALRLLIAGGALALICLVRKESLPPRKEIIRHAVCGLLIFIGGIVAVVWAQQFISSSLASTIITTPFWFVILDRRQWKFYFSTKWIPAGLLLGLSGVVLLMASRTGGAAHETGSMQFVAILLIVGGSFLWAGTSLYVRYQSVATSVYVSTAIQMLSAGTVTIMISALSGELSTFQLEQVQSHALYSLLYLALVSSMMGFLCFMWLINVQPPAIVSTYSYVNPLVATLLGWMLANETITSMQLIALGIILLGVLLVNIPRYYAMGGVKTPKV